MLNDNCESKTPEMCSSASAACNSFSELHDRLVSSIEKSDLCTICWSPLQKLHTCSVVGGREQRGEKDTSLITTRCQVSKTSHLHKAIIFIKIMLSLPQKFCDLHKITTFCSTTSIKSVCQELDKPNPSALFVEPFYHHQKYKGIF